MATHPCHVSRAGLSRGTLRALMARVPSNRRLSPRDTLKCEQFYIISKIGKPGKYSSLTFYNDVKRFKMFKMKS